MTICASEERDRIAWFSWTAVCILINLPSHLQSRTPRIINLPSHLQSRTPRIINLPSHMQSRTPRIINLPLTCTGTCQTLIFISRVIATSILISFLVNKRTGKYHGQQPVHRCAGHSAFSLTYLSVCLPRILINFLIQVHWGISSSSMDSTSKLEVSSPGKKFTSQLKNTAES